jgi:F420-dependent oxidoreductase-like protein
MRFSLVLGYGLSWDAMVDLATCAEQAGVDGLWFPDHFMSSDDEALDQPVFECWSVLAGLAALVPRVRIGAMVTGNTYRHPAVLAKMAATVDHISGGRLVVGLGAGWQENEHRRYGLELGTAGQRLARLDEACQVVRGLLHEDRTSLQGRYYQLKEAPSEPKPLGPVPLMIGGSGEKVTLRIVARYADEWNGGGSPEEMRRLGGVLDGHCKDVGRDPSEIVRTASLPVFLSRDESWLASLRDRGLGSDGQTYVCNPSQAVDLAGQYADAGVGELLLNDFTLGGKLDRKKSTLQLFMSEVAPQVQ